MSRQACRTCPWRLENQGRPSPGGWFTKANLRRLWDKLRRGEQMSCHYTDARVAECDPPPGYRPPPPGGEILECVGALVLQQREVMYFQDVRDLRLYRKAHPMGMTRGGFARLVERLFFGGTPLGGRPVERPDLNDESVQHEPLGRWVPRKAPPEAPEAPVASPVAKVGP